MSEIHSSYYNTVAVAEVTHRSQHREVIGGLWDEIGELQLRTLQAYGLQPGSRLLDIGCGSLRLGVRAVDYLNAGNYWGTDINDSLLSAGHEKEIVPAGLAEKLPRRQLVANGDFDFSGLPRAFDMAIAQSLFTHLPLNHLRLCLANLAEHLTGACDFLATFFLVPNELVSKPFSHSPGSVITHPHRDPYHYTVADLYHAAAGLPWNVDPVGNWNHPRNQQLVRFTKLT